MDEILGGNLSIAGERVTWKEAVRVSATLACCRVICNGVAQVPWRVYLEKRDGVREVAKDHPLSFLVSHAPNADQTSFDFRQTLMLHVLLSRGAYVFINRIGRARDIREMRLILPDRVTVNRESEGVFGRIKSYTVRGENGAVAEFPRESIWHIPGLSWDTQEGMDTVRLAANAIGLSLSIERTQSEFQRNGARTSGVLSVKEDLSEQKYKFLAAWLDKHLPGGERAFKPMIADNEAKYSSMTMSGVDQQLIETRRHQVEEVCRHFGVMPLMIGHPADMAARAATESIFVQHVVHTLSPWYKKLEESADIHLLGRDQIESGYYTKFIPNALMRGDSKSRAEFYARGLGSGGTKGWLTQNDVRGFEDMNRIDDPEADKLPQPTSSQADSATTDTEAPEVPQNSEEDDSNADS